LIFDLILDILNYVREQALSRKEHKGGHLSYKRKDSLKSVVFSQIWDNIEK